MKKTKLYQKNILIILSLSIVVTVLSTTMLLYHFERYSAVSEKLQNVKWLSGRVMYFDEVMTMSVRMYAQTQEQKWLERYQENALLFDKTIAEAATYEPKFNALFKDNAEDSRFLIQTESQAISYVQTGSIKEAQAQLNSAAYSEHKLGYKQQINESFEAVQNEFKTMKEEHNTLYKFFVYLIVFLMGSFIFAWLYLLKFLKINNAHLNNLITTDELTGLSNRRAFDEVLKRELRRSTRDEKILMLAVLDIDYFKKYNDYYGHPKGDMVLSIFGQKIQKIIRRASEYSFRLGGEEFAIIAVVDRREQGLLIIKRFKKLLAERSIEHKGNEVDERVTFSAGVAFHHAEDVMSEDELYIAADRALYKAKNLGRNQIVEYSEIENQ